MREWETRARRLVTVSALDVMRDRLLAEGLCVGAGPDDDRWFPPAARSGLSPERAREAQRAARRACAGCPVMELCREWALVTRQEYGVWGGRAEHELAELREARRLEKRRAARRAGRRRVGTASTGDTAA